MSYKPRTGAGPSARALFDDLACLQHHGVMFGHQDASLTGCVDSSSKWTATGGPMLEPDIFRVSGKFPAVYGFDFGWLTDSEAYPLVPPLFANAEEAFQIHQSLAYFHHSLGGIVTFSWHVSDSFSRTDQDLEDLVAGRGSVYGQLDAGTRWKRLYKAAGRRLIRHATLAGHSALNESGDLHQTLKEKLNKLADFAKSLRDEDGTPVPILFRPWHENNVDQWWWGPPNAPADYRDLWQATVRHMDGVGATNLLYVYSPNLVNRSPEDGVDPPVRYFEDAFEATYPGDDVVDVLALDFYPYNDKTQDFVDQIDYVCGRAREAGKLAAIAECGIKRLKRGTVAVDDYWTNEYIAPFREKDENLLSYALIWKNLDPTSEFYGPFPGQGSEADFNLMAANSKTLVRCGCKFRKKVLFREDVAAKRACFARRR